MAQLVIEALNSDDEQEPQQVKQQNKHTLVKYFAVEGGNSRICLTVYKEQNGSIVRNGGPSSSKNLSVDKMDEAIDIYEKHHGVKIHPSQFEPLPKSNVFKGAAKLMNAIENYEEHTALKPFVENFDKIRKIFAPKRRAKYERMKLIEEENALTINEDGVEFTVINNRHSFKPPPDENNNNNNNNNRSGQNNQLRMSSDNNNNNRPARGNRIRKSSDNNNNNRQRSRSRDRNNIKDIIASPGSISATSRSLRILYKNPFHSAAVENVNSEINVLVLSGQCELIFNRGQSVVTLDQYEEFKIPANCRIEINVEEQENHCSVLFTFVNLVISEARPCFRQRKDKSLLFQANDDE